MIDTIKKISRIQNVSGAETNLYSEFDRIKNSHYHVLYLPNRSVVFKRNEKAKTLLAVPMDVPGFVLVPKNGKSYLLPTLSFDAEKLKNKKILINNSEYLLKTDVKEPKRAEDFYVTKEFSIGENGKLYTGIKKIGARISGRYVSNYALIESAFQFLSSGNDLNCDIIFLSQTYSEANSLSQYQYLEKYENCIEMTLFEGEKTAAFVKFGKFFSDKDLLNRFSVFERKIGEKQFCRNFSPLEYDIKCLNIGLPVKNHNQDDEMISPKIFRDAFDKIFDILKTM